MRTSSFFQGQYETCSVERPPVIQGEAVSVIAEGVKMLIDPAPLYRQPTEQIASANEKPMVDRYSADIGNKSHAGVSDISKFDIVRTAAGREFVILEVLDAVGTDVLQLSLQLRS